MPSFVHIRFNRVYKNSLRVVAEFQDISSRYCFTDDRIFVLDKETLLKRIENRKKQGRSNDEEMKALNAIREYQKGTKCE
ncbi:MAG TPA: hypothetical protein VH815_11605 [Acidobacteriota bacterium]|jgi:alkyl hydroperoxide reductase subunit AhpC